MDVFGRFLLCLVFCLALYALVLLYFWGGLPSVAGYALFVHALLRLAEFARKYEEEQFAAAQMTPVPVAVCHN